MTGLQKKVKISIIDSKDSEIVQKEVIKMLSEFKLIIKTITSDNGKDPRALIEQATQFSLHQAIAKGLCIDYYFTRPYHRWE